MDYMLGENSGNDLARRMKIDSDSDREEPFDKLNRFSETDQQFKREHKEIDIKLESQSNAAISPKSQGAISEDKISTYRANKQKAQTPPAPPDESKWDIIYCLPFFGKPGKHSYLVKYKNTNDKN